MLQQSRNPFGVMFGQALHQTRKVYEPSAFPENSLFAAQGRQACEGEQREAIFQHPQSFSLFLQPHSV